MSAFYEVILGGIREHDGYEAFRVNSPGNAWRWMIQHRIDEFLKLIVMDGRPDISKILYCVVEGDEMTGAASPEWVPIVERSVTRW
jgi:hypothetical protein